MTNPVNTPNINDNNNDNESKKAPKKGGFFSNLIFNIVIPVLVLTRLNGDDALGPVYALLVALSFPIGYGLWEMRITKKINGFSILGVVSVLLTGGIALLELDPKYVAIKEAAIPGLIGLAVILSQKSHRSIVRLMIFNDQLIQMDKVNDALALHSNEALFDKKMSVVTYIVAMSFFVSSALNYILAKIVVVSPAGTAEFTSEIGRMMALSYPVIVIPSMVVLVGAMWYLFAQLKALTHLSLDDLMVDTTKK